MIRSSLNLILAICLGMLIVLTWVARRDFTARNVELLPGMVNTQRYNDQSENANFHDGKTLQPSVPGTIARGYTPLHYAKTTEDAARAGQELRNPIPDTSESDLERGAIVFATFCQPCHGPNALGDGPVAKRGFPPPPSLLADKAVQFKDGQMFHIITYGQGNMPAMNSQVSQIDRWRVIKHLRLLQTKSATLSVR